MENEFSNIRYYDINPFDIDEQVDWKLFSSKDLVLVQNYWGLKKTVYPIGNRPIIVEDHSHGWLTQGCLESRADFCIASLRKTIPVPLGGIAWKPRKSLSNLPFPKAENKFAPISRSSMNISWSLITKAMELKSKAATNEDKREFLGTYINGELYLGENFDILPLEEDHYNTIKPLLLKDFNVFKKRNLAYLNKKLLPTKKFKRLHYLNGTPFGLLFIFKDRETLDQLKKHLIEKSIYPAELWNNNPIKYQHKYLLNIHVDFRYTPNDLDYIAKSINEWQYICDHV
ncbi:hypothetical protein NYZ99_07265 [Maribacter litopenaei]|uniref:Uncharacterized protein n=1 Tax=Maribacter litopenaei TaxID=2976127 RepID=A0ABY5YAL6_9FLAO|nr:hypothetical protein [Maribacter litopenaei]UWX56095.1 hypothetical protein NYZ99_07265 [Maribacter litopenaei]